MTRRAFTAVASARPSLLVVIARDTIDAEQFHAYDEDEATAELVCVLPASAQNVDAPGWPAESTLRACGAEFLLSSDEPFGHARTTAFQNESKS